MLNTGLLPRPFSNHAPRVPGYEPLISPRVTKVGRGRTAWRCEVLVDGTPMATSHHATKREAESNAEGFLVAYTKAHYLDR